MTPEQHPSYPRQHWIRAGAIAFIVLAGAAGFVYWRVSGERVAIDTSSIVAPQITLSPAHAGILQEVYVHEGDEVNADTVVARVGNELVKTQTAGTIVSVPLTIGAIVSPNQAVATEVDRTQLRVVGKLDEDKGLSRIQVGDQVSFTVDAFGSRTYTAIVDEVAPMSDQSGIVFNISDKREVKQFSVKARFDVNVYRELKNGMSARMWVFTQ